VDAADPASYDGAQTVGSWGWTWIRSEIEIPQFEALHQMRAQILYHEATDTGNVYVMDPCLRPIG
jgi:hypothetical protein